MKARPATAADFDAILVQNEESVAALSPMTVERLSALHAQSALHRLVEDDGAVVAFLLRLRRCAGTFLYRELFGFAAASAVDLVTCGYDLDPPNPRSRRFHARFGFAEVDRQRLAGNGKHVSLQAARVALRGFSGEPVSE